MSERVTEFRPEDVRVLRTKFKKIGTVLIRQLRDSNEAIRFETKLFDFKGGQERKSTQTMRMRGSMKRDMDLVRAILLTLEEIGPATFEKESSVLYNLAAKFPELVKKTPSSSTISDCWKKAGSLLRTMTIPMMNSLSKTASSRGRAMSYSQIFEMKGCGKR